MSASDDHTRLLSVAEAISEGTPVDWNDIHANADLSSLDIVHELKAIEELARSHEATPTTWGQFAIVGEIARGAFGTVYLASDPSLNLTVALKVVRPRTPDAPIDPARAFFEAQLLAKISHPNIVRVYRADRVGDEVGFAMELVKGRTLDDLVQTQTPFSANEATMIGIELCRALAVVHRSGALHGDIKAHNVMRGEGGRIVLMDFGAGKDLNIAPRHSGIDFVGTPLYMAPEVFAGKPRSKATDLYSLGVLLYYLVSGAYPVAGSTRTEVERGHLQPGQRRPLRDVRPDVPSAFARVVERTLAERPDERFQSAGELEAALAGTLAQRKPIPWKPLLVAAALLVVAGLTVAMMFRQPDRELADLQRPASPGLGGAASAALPAGTYRIKAVLNREQDGIEVPIPPGSPLAPSERLSLDVDISVPAHVYIVNEDERGDSILLFPLRGREPSNPLPAGRHRLPGMLDDEKLYWQVTTAGGREHFMVIASPTRSAMFEKMFASLPSPVQNQPIDYPRLSGEALGALRSVGGLAVAPAPANAPQLRLTPGFAIPLSDKEETVQGVWIRQATFENPE
jgi:eukaryotic-like serine/threonine-protein kinase